VGLKDVIALTGAGDLFPWALAAALLGWLILTLVLWRNGFGDLFERFVRPRWSARQRLATAFMIPLRAVLLMLAAGIASVGTTLGTVAGITAIMAVVKQGAQALGG
jgi:hypothetical protein